MGNTDEALTRLGRSIDAEHDELLRRRAPDPRRRERFLAAALPAAPRRARIAMRATGLALAAALAMTLLLFFGARPLSFSVGAGDAVVAGTLGAWIATPPDRAIPIHFSDGTHYEVQPDAKVRVAEVEAKGGRLVLENGVVRASVVPRAGARWRLQSGPFEVRVTGTRFDLGWDLAEETLTLKLDEGSVLVSGPIVGEGLPVRAGDTLVVRRKEERFELRRSAPAITAAREAPIDPAPEVAAPSAPQSVEPAITASPAPPRAAIAPKFPRPSWRELVAAGRYKEALAAVDRDGFRRVCAEGSAADLRDLADAARLSGDAARAVEALGALRRRFAGDEQAAEAAFLLGIIAFDQQGAHAEAARWFAAYLDERPRGRLAREAAGRLLEARARSGDKAEAREAARRYLRDHPTGPHAEMAKAIAGE